MKSSLFGVILIALSFAPTLSFAKGVPMFFQTGDELFEIEGAPQYEGGYSAGDLNEKEMTEFSAKYR